MNFDKLRYFCEVAHTGHLGRAAKNLSISASAVSHAISDLEEELGVALFTHTGRRIMLTSEGSYLHQKSRDILDQLNQARGVLSSGKREFPESVRIATTHGEILRCTAAALGRAGEAQQKMTFELLSMRSADVLRAVIAHEIDLGICLNPQPHPQIETRTIAQWKLGVCHSAQHPVMQSKKKVKGHFLTSLAAFPYIAPKTFQGIENCERHAGLLELGLTPAVKGVFDSYDTMASCLAVSTAWCLAPAFVLGARTDVVWRDPGWTHGVEVVCAWIKSRPPSQTILKIVNDLSKELCKPYKNQR